MCVLHPRTSTRLRRVLSVLVAAGIASVARAGNLRQELIDPILAGDQAIALRRITEQRVETDALAETLLVELQIARAQNRPQALADVQVQLEGLARAYQAALDDSLWLRLLASARGMTGEALIEDRNGWRSYREAEQLYRESRWADAETALARAREQAVAAGDDHLAGVALTLCGSCRWMTGSFGEARDAYRQALVHAEQTGHETQRARLLRNIAATLNLQHRGDEAIGVLHEVVDLAERIGYRMLLAETLNDVGIHYVYRGDVDRARPWLERARREARALGHERLEGNIHQNLGLMCVQAGDPLRALEHFEAALAIARRVGNRRGEVGALLNQASIRADLEQHSQRRRLLCDALVIAEELGVHDAAAQIRNEIGETCQQLGRHRDALIHHAEALGTSRRLGMIRSQCVALHNLGQAHMALGEAGPALEAFRESAELLASHGPPAEYAGALIDQGRAAFVAGDLDQADRHLRAALAIADTLDHPVLCGNVHYALGRVALTRGDVETAADRFEEALRQSARLPPELEHWRALLGLSEVRLARRRYREADSLLAAAIEHVEAQREHLEGDVFRRGFMENKRELYVRRIAGLLAARAESEEDDARRALALHIAERARGRVLLDLLGGLLPTAPEDSALGERHLRLTARLSTLQSALSRAVSGASWDSSRVDSLGAHLEETKRAFRACRDEIAARSPLAAGMARRCRPLDADAIASRVLGEQQVLLEYIVDHDACYLLRLDRTSLRAFRVPCGAGSLRTCVAALRAETQKALSRAVPPMARTLYALLMEEAVGDLPPSARLLLVPDGPLCYLPFAALHDGEAYLGERFALCHAPSASALDPSLCKRRPSGDRRLLAVGNPRSYRTQDLLKDGGPGENDTLRQWRDWSFAELPYAAEEARRVANHFEQADVLLGEEATEEQIKTRAGCVSHLHLATHGLLDEEDPLMSAVVLAQDDDPAEDGLLQVHEIMQLDLRADLVALSACNTGLGQVVHGEGLLGLTHAFLCAGARALLVSLWEIPDRSTAGFMDRFYAGLARGQPADLALRDAQRRAIAEGESPRAWSAFVLAGHASTAESDSPRRLIGDRRFLGAPVLVVLIVLLWAVAARRRRRRA